MELDAVVGFRFKFIGVEVLNDPSLPPGSNGLLSSGSSRENFHMDHVMLLPFELGVIVDPTVEN